MFWSSWVNSPTRPSPTVRLSTSMTGEIWAPVPQSSSSVTGTGLLTQAINPPLHANSAFHGLVHVLVFGGSVTQIYSLHGSALPPLLGAPHVTHLVVTLDGLWGKEGKATYTYVVGDKFHEVKDVPVKVTWLLQE